ncbi:putative mitochondrial protein [Apostasia shenzhenica]|uniref:Putative mitochondrial protein n=1 Tax=Apostasia shenzhenica TaxID=1088818 RepID=A0A2H9ZU19_9ASPA|nr:putative mitochondrial protein [Apostasia shenzhenica]
MRFGLTNAPSTCQCVMNKVFKDQLRQFVLVFFYDILVYSKTWEDHIPHLEEVFQILLANSLHVKESKCEFGTNQISYLGHVISAEGVKAEPEKIETILQWPEPKNLKELHGFLGLTGYYRRFLQGYGDISKPLTILLKKGQFQWSQQAKEVFQNLK